MQIKRTINGRTSVILETPINEGCIRKWQLQGDDYITLKFNLAHPVTFRIGDFCDTTEADGGEAGRFYVTEPAFPSYNKDTGGYEYELQLDAEYKLWNNLVMKYTTATSEVEWKLTDTLDNHLGQLLRNLAAAGLGTCWNGKKYTYNIDWEQYAPDDPNKVLSGVVSTEAKLVEYSNTKLVEALDAMAEAWECEWWVEANVIHFGYCELANEPTELALGDNVESWSVDKSSGTHATRVYAFGSTRNIPSTYRRSVLISTAIRDKQLSYIMYTDPVVFLTQSQVDVDTETYRGITVTTDQLALKEQVKPAGANYTRNIYRQKISTVLPSGSDFSLYSYELMPHELEFEDTSPSLTFAIHGYSDNASLGKNWHVYLKVSLVVRDKDDTDLYEYGWNEQDVSAPYGTGTNVKLTLPRYIPCFGRDLTLEVRAKITKQAQAGYALINKAQISKAKRQSLLACPFGVYVVDSNCKKLKDVTIYVAYRNLPSPSLGAAQDEKDRYQRNYTLRGKYWYVGNTVGDPIGEHRLLVPEEVQIADIPYAWYTDNYDGNPTLYTIGDRRLMLPEGTEWVEMDGLADHEVVEDVVEFDDIYPRQKDLKVGALESREADGVVTTYEDGTQQTEKYTAYYFRDSKWVADGEPWLYEDYLISGQSLRVRFSSGMLNGMEFDVKMGVTVYDEDNKSIGQYDQIIRNEDYGVKLPNDILFPKVDDKIIYIGWDDKAMGKTGLVEPAEQELLAKAQEYLRKARIDDRTYEATLMDASRYGTSHLKEQELKQLQEANLLDLAVIETREQTTDFTRSMMQKGRKVKVYDDSAIIYDPELKKEVNWRQSRVIGYEYPLDIPYDHPKVTVGVSGIYSRLADIENKLRKTSNG